MREEAQCIREEARQMREEAQRFWEESKIMQDQVQLVHKEAQRLHEVAGTVREDAQRVEQAYQQTQANISALAETGLAQVNTLAKHICLMCGEEERDCVFTPCGHFVYCMECVYDIINREDDPHREIDLAQCPVCRVDRTFVGMYYS